MEAIAVARVPAKQHQHRNIPEDAARRRTNNRRFTQTWMIPGNRFDFLNLTIIKVPLAGRISISQIQAQLIGKVT